MWEELPTETLAHILSLLDLEGALNASGVSTRWCNVVNKWILRNRAVYRGGNHWMPRKFSALHLTVPLSDDQIQRLCNPEVTELELRLDEYGRWRGFEGFARNLRRLKSVRRLALTNVILERSHVESLLENVPVPLESLRIFSDIGEEAGDLLMENRELFSEVMVFTGRGGGRLGAWGAYPNQCESFHFLVPERLVSLRLETAGLRSLGGLGGCRLEEASLRNALQIGDPTVSDMSHLPLRTLSVSDARKVSEEAWTSAFREGFASLESLELRGCNVSATALESLREKPLHRLVLDPVDSEYTLRSVSFLKDLRTLKLGIPYDPQLLSALRDLLLVSSWKRLKRLVLCLYINFDNSSKFHLEDNPYRTQITNHCQNNSIHLEYICEFTRIVSSVVFNQN